MGKKRRPSRVSDRVAAVTRPGIGERDRLAALAAGALALAFLAAGLLVDMGTSDAFDSVKRLWSLVLVALAAAALGFSRPRDPLASSAGKPLRRWSLLLLAAALLLGLLSAVASPRRGLALDAFRALLIWALLLPIGASRVLDRRRGLLLSIFLSVVAINAAISLLQARGVWNPLRLSTEPGSREATGAFVGNVGYLAVALALATVAVVGTVLMARRKGTRLLAAAAGLLFMAALLVNQNLTSLSALVVGVAILLFARLGHRALAPAAGGVLLLALAVAAYPPMRGRIAATVRAARAGDWNALVTYRVGAWKAAWEMAKERPILGFGPGTFGAEFVPHRLRAEIATRRRLVNPLLTAAYSETHCEYLQPLAEAGLPAGLAAIAAVGLLFGGLVRTLRYGEEKLRGEATFLLAFLGAGATAALIWFPLQRPISALPLLLAAGRGWRISDSQALPDHRTEARA